MDTAAIPEPHREGAECPEREAKFLLTDPEVQEAELFAYLQEVGFTVGPAEDLRQIDRYFDTDAGDLFQAGWSYRWREAAPHQKWIALKSLGGIQRGVHQRQEVEQAVDSLPESHGALPAGPVAERLQSLPNAAPERLRELFQVHTHRRVFRLQRDAVTVLLCVDDTAVATPADPAAAPLRYHEVELELQGGDPASLEDLAGEIAGKLRLLPARLSKFDRGSRASAQAAGLVPSSDPASPLPTPGDPVTVLARSQLVRQFETMMREEPWVWEGLNPEGVHQMRVASRRLRVALQVFKPWLPAPATSRLLTELKWVGASLGGVRDLDVYRAAIGGYSQVSGCDPAEFRRYLDARWDEARRELTSAMASDRYASFKDAFREYLDDGFWERAAAGHEQLPTVRHAAKQLLIPALKKFLRKGRKIDARSPDECLHTLRIRAKRLRYHFEIFAPLFADRLEPFTKSTKSLQDVLGGHQDACVALERIDDYEEIANGPSEPEILTQLRLPIRRRRKLLRKRFPRVWRSLCDHARPKRLRRALRKQAGH